jgi:hypothetical protein
MTESSISRKHRIATWLFLLISLLLANSIGAQQYSKPPKFAVDVFNSIFNAMNDNRTDRPYLKLSNDPNEIAKRDPNDANGQSVVIIGKGLIDLTRSFGADSSNALAHVLGHELAHVFKHQNDLNMVGSGYASKELKREIRELNDSLSFSVFERQADECAVFYCHIAGYHTVQIGAAVLDSIYQKFHLTDRKLKKYPTLAERKEIVKNSEMKMKALCMMHDDGLLALANGNISCAKELFKEILRRQFTSREIYNNLGLCFLLEVINEIDTLIYPYSFPVQFDFQTNLNFSSERGLGEDERDNLLRAIENFTKATNSNDDYYIGHLNMAISYFLLEDYSKMNVELEYSNKSEDPVIQESVQNMRAIYLHRIGEIKEARKVLKGKDLALFSSARNLAIIDGVAGGHRKNNTVIKKSDLDNDVIELLDSFNEISSEIPDVDFNIPAALTLGRETLKPLGEGLGVKLRIVENRESSSRRWIVNGNSFSIYRRNFEFQIQQLYWKKLESHANSSFHSSNAYVLIFDDYILKKVNEEVTLFKIK